MKYIFPCHTAEEPSVLFCDETVSRSEVKSSEGWSEAIESLVNANTSPHLTFSPLFIATLMAFSLPFF